LVSVLINPFIPTTLSGVYQLSFNIPLSSKLNITGNIPYISSDYEIDYGYYTYKYDRNGIGNIFVGVQTNPGTIEDSKSFVTFGIFLSTADERTAYSGLYTNYYDLQKFTPDALGLYFNYAHHKIINVFNYGFEVGPNILIPTGEFSETELFIHFGVDAGYQINKLLISTEFIGVAIISQQADTFGDRFVNMFNLGAQWKEDVITPKVFYKIYLREEMRDMIDGVLGLGVSVSIV